MYPYIKLGSLHYPTYSILFKDSLPVTESYIKTLLHNFDNNDKLFEMVLSKFGFYEIITGNTNDLYTLFSEIYEENYEYYHELLVNYKKEYDYAIGNRRTVKRHDVGSNNKGGSRTNSYDDTSKEYDLPNRSINSGDGNLTSKNESNGGTSDEYTENGNNVYDSEVTNVYDNEFLDLKRKYLSQIRNVYSEFANKFSECFIHMYN